MLTVGSLFSGIGGMDLGLERAGMRIAWQVESNPYRLRVLARHWPAVPRYPDIRTIDWSQVPPVDLIAGGFPCQDISHAGHRIGIEGPRSSLWREFARCVRMVRPSYLLLENVAALINRGLGTVLGDLATIGYSAEWDILAARDFGAPHIRERIFLIGYAHRRDLGGGIPGREQGQARPAPRFVDPPIGEPVRGPISREPNDPALSLAENVRRRFGAWCGWESTGPVLCRMGDGIPERLERIRALGDSVCPQVAEALGRRILEVIE